MKRKECVLNLLLRRAGKINNFETWWFSIFNLKNWFCVFIFILLPSFARAEKLKLLVLPLSDGTSYVYSVNLKKTCSFEGVDEVITTKLKLGKKGNWFIENINLLQKKINFEIETKEINVNHVVFSLNSAKNLTFEFSFAKPDCKLVKTLHFEDKAYSLDEIYIEYKSALFSPVIKKVNIVNNGVDTDLSLYPWALHGALPVYELSAGPALNIHSNIRLNNLNTFEKNNPIVEPIPAFFFRYGPLFLNKDGLGSLLYHTDEFSLLAMGLLEGEPYKAKGLHERKKGLFVGSILKYNLFELFYYNDFFKNKGYNIKLNLAPEFYVRVDWKFIPQIFVQYWDSKYVDYYFGVKPDESISGMKNFKGHHTINFGTMFEVMHYVGNWTFIGDIGVKSYGKEVFTSPTVVRKNEVRFITSVLYRFF